MRRWIIAAAFLALPGASAIAQTVAAKHVLFVDPKQGGTWKDGELVLGKTTLSGAKRMFPDAPKIHPWPYIHALNEGNPSMYGDELAWSKGNEVLKPQYSFHLGQGRYNLLFDDKKRLVYIFESRWSKLDESTNRVVSHDPWKATTVTRDDFMARYRNLRGKQSEALYFLGGPIQPCVSLVVVFESVKGRESLNSVGYQYTCETLP